jgi:hypothetical protein
VVNHQLYIMYIDLRYLELHQNRTVHSFASLSLDPRLGLVGDGDLKDLASSNGGSGQVGNRSPIEEERQRGQGRKGA